jgi:hypothetical protein
MPTTGFYASALDAYAEGDIRPLTDTLRVYLLDSGYTVNLAAHQFLSSVSSSDRIGFYTLANKTVVAGAFDNTVDASISNPLGATGVAVICVKWTGSDATSLLIFYDDDFAPSTSDPVNVAFDAGGIWELVG